MSSNVELPLWGALHDVKPRTKGNKAQPVIRKAGQTPGTGRQNPMKASRLQPQGHELDEIC